MWYVLGFIFGPLAWLGAAMSKPEEDDGRVGKAIIGFAGWFVIIFLVFLAAG